MSKDIEPEGRELKLQKQWEEKAQRFKIDRDSPLFLYAVVYNKETNMELNDEGIFLKEWNPVTKKGIRSTPIKEGNITTDFKHEDVYLPNTYTIFKLKQGQGHLVDFVKEMQEFLATRDIKLILTKF